MQKGFNDAVIAAIEAQTAAGAISYEQQLNIKIALGELTLEQAQLLLFYEKIKHITSNILGVVEVDGVQVNLGSFILNSSPEIFADINKQISELIASGDFQKAEKIEKVVETVAKLQATGTITEKQVADVLKESIEGVLDGKSVEVAVGTAVKPSFEVDIEEAKAELQAKIEDAFVS